MSQETVYCAVSNGSSLRAGSGQSEGLVTGSTWRRAERLLGWSGLCLMRPVSVVMDSFVVSI